MEELGNNRFNIEDEIIYAPNMATAIKRYNILIEKGDYPRTLEESLERQIDRARAGLDGLIHFSKKPRTDKNLIKMIDNMIAGDKAKLNTMIEARSSL